MIRDILAPFRQKAFLDWQNRSSPSSRRIAQSIFCIIGGVVTGTVGWSGNLHLFPVGMLFPAFWAYAPRRRVAALVAAAHFLGASRGLPQGVMTFFGTQLAIALGLWGLAALMFTGVHAALWTSKTGWQRPLRYLVALLLMSVPPFGIMGWANPITAAGILFPGGRWLGLAATVILLCAMTTRHWKIAVPVIAGLAVWSAALWMPPPLPDGWVGINTAFRFDHAGQYADYVQHQKTIALVRKAAHQGAHVAVLPESAFGIWTPTTKHLWQNALADLDITVIGGAVVLDPTGYDSVLIQVSGAGSNILYHERMPVPVSMWQPWHRLFGAQEGAHAGFFDNPVGFVGNTRVASLICYEQLIIWPIIQSMFYRPDVIIAPANGWWTHGTTIVAIQKASAKAWASLFGVPLMIAFNA